VAGDVGKGGAAAGAGVVTPPEPSAGTVINSDTQRFSSPVLTKGFACLRPIKLIKQKGEHIKTVIR